MMRARPGERHDKMKMYGFRGMGVKTEKQRSFRKEDSYSLLLRAIPLTKLL